jgi:hypothetical protein
MLYGEFVIRREINMQRCNDVFENSFVRHYFGENIFFYHSYKNFYNSKNTQDKVGIKFSIGKKKYDFRNNLNRFYFEKLILRTYHIVHYKHFLRDQNNWLKCILRTPIHPLKGNSPYFEG